MAVELGRLREEVRTFTLSLNFIVTSNKLQLASLCENVSNLVSGSGSGSGSGGRQSPTTTISAVSKLAQEHSETNDKLTTITQQLEEVQKLYIDYIGKGVYFIRHLDQN